MGRRILLGRIGCRALWCREKYALLQEKQPLSMRLSLFEGMFIYGPVGVGTIPLVMGRMRAIWAGT